MSRKSLDLTLSLLKAIDRAGSAEKILDASRPYLQGFGIDHIIASTIPAPGVSRSAQRNLVLFESVPPDWKKIYFARGYVYVDPIVRETLNRSTGFRWSDPDLGRYDGEASAQVMNQASDLGLRDGFTVPMTTLEQERGGISFVGERLEIAPVHRGMLTLVASYMFGQALMAQGSAGARVRALTPREREALQWAAEGKTDWEIGELMTISEHGVDYHLRAARAKLGAVSRAQAVAEALRRGFIV